MLCMLAGIQEININNQIHKKWGKSQEIIKKNKNPQQAIDNEYKNII